MEDYGSRYCNNETNPILYNSYVFHTRLQSAEETFVDFLNDVIELANYCEFEEKTRMIRDRIIAGMRNSNLRNILFNLGNPNLDDLLEYLKTVQIHSESLPQELNNEEETIEYNEKNEEECVQTENADLGSCEVESHEDFVDEPEDFKSNAIFEEENTDFKVPVATFEVDFNNPSCKVEEELPHEDPPDSNDYENCSVQNTLHSYIIKKEPIDNISNKYEVDSTKTENWDQSNADQSGSSGDGNSQSGEGFSSSQCILQDFKKEEDNCSADNDVIQNLEVEKGEIKSGNNFNGHEIRNNRMKRDFETGSCPVQPKRTNKIIHIIELSDSDEEDVVKVEPNLRTEKIVKDEKPSQDIFVKKELPGPVNNIVPNVNIPNDIDSINVKSLNHQTEEKGEEKENCEKEVLLEKNSRSGDYIENSYTCSECSKTFSSKYILRTHILSHTGNNPFECSKCLKTLSSLQSLNTHMLIHSNKKPYNCNNCGKSFRQKSNLDSHLIKHAEENVECNEATKTFTGEIEASKNNKKKCTKQGRKRGKKYSETLGPFACHECNKSFLNKFKFISHMSSLKHTGQKPFKCERCFKTFSKPHSLKVHMLIHTGEKPLKCSVCAKSFRQQANLDAHLTKHSGDKPYKCNECSKTFTCRAYLTTHLQIHSGVTFCDKCNKHFSSVYRLKKHLSLHRKKKTYHCDFCDKSFLYPGLLKRHEVICSITI